ncbi:MAG: LrgB family protein [Heyndrickxia sp.]
MIIITVYSIILTIIVYLFAIFIAKKFPSPFTTPVFLSTTIIIIVLFASHISYQDYEPAKSIMTYLLGPATVALAVPLYKNRHILFKNFLPALVGVFSGTIFTIVTAVFLGKLFKLSNLILTSLSIKSTTIPVASEISKIIGGDQLLVAAFVMITGMFGAMFGLKILNGIRVSNPFSRGLSLGTISHGIGTSEAVKEGELQGAVSGVAMGISAVFTSIIVPMIIPWLIK